MQKKYSLCLALLALLLLGGCQGARRYEESSFDTFDTVITLTADCGSQREFDRMSAMAFAEYRRLHQLFDAYQSHEGVVSLFDVNAQAGGGPVKVPRETMDLLLLAKELYELTGGRVNVAMGGVTELWRQARLRAEESPQSAALPDKKALEQARAHADIEDLILDEAALTVQFGDPRLALDVGAVAKGYATQRVAGLLLENGYQNFVISAGGNVLAQGGPGQGQGRDWTVGVQDPQGDGIIATLEARDTSAVTSGGYLRYFTLDGVQYHHIIDPDTLMPADNVLSATVVYPDSGVADGLSTAVFLMEPQQALEFIRGIPGARVILLTKDRQVLDSGP